MLWPWFVSIDFAFRFIVVHRAAGIRYLPTLEYAVIVVESACPFQAAAIYRWHKLIDSDQFMHFACPSLIVLIKGLL
ncbi:MAG: hypothetical protein ACI9PC_001647 [Porticoccaceae bacterium]|jgi:hypothetical protein